MSEVNGIQEVFGQFAVQLNGKIEMFPTEAEAGAALAMAEHAEEYNNLADQYCASKGFEGKAAKGKHNVVVDFLATQAAGFPAPVVEGSDDAESTEETATDEAIDF